MKRAWTLPLLLFFFGCEPERTALAQVGELSPKPWTPPRTTVAPEIVENATFLLSHGMGDPRGGTFRKATALVGSVWGRDEKPVEVHGWVHPQTGKTPARIVTLDGLVRDVVSIGEEADVADEFKVMPETASRQWIVAGPIPETIGVLLIAGEIDLAEKLDDSRRREPVQRTTEFPSRLFDQAITAHMRGDDRTALEIARLISRIRPDFEKRAMNVDPKTGVLPDGTLVPVNKSYEYLDVIPALIQDTERRLSQPPRPRPDADSISALSLVELIDRLDEVSARQQGQPGGVNLTEDSIVAALIKKGNEAAEPLLDVIENDKRLTRSVSFPRDFFPARNLIPVRTAAYVAFISITKTVFDTSSGQEIDVSKLREFWKENAGRTGPESWLAILANDSAGERRWMDAAARLFDGANVVRYGPGVTVPKDSGPLNAEAIRSHSNPTLSELLARRARELCGSGRVVSSQDGFACANGLRLSLLLEKWDPSAAQTSLRVVSRRAMEMAVQPMGFAPTLSLTATGLVEALEARHRLGDTEVWTEYAVWLPKLEDVSHNDGIKTLWPLVSHGNEPALRGMARQLFLDPDGPYNPARLDKSQYPNGGRAETMALTPLLAIPEFSQAILQMLDDKTVVGESWVDEKGAMTVRRGNSIGSSGPDSSVRMDPRTPKVGEKRDVRLCDKMAMALMRLKGVPDFQPYWPDSDKDQAIRRLASYLRANAARIEDLLPWPQNWRTFPSNP